MRFSIPLITTEIMNAILASTHLTGEHRPRSIGHRACCQITQHTNEKEKHGKILRCIEKYRDNRQSVPERCYRQVQAGLRYIEQEEMFGGNGVVGKLEQCLRDGGGDTVGLVQKAPKVNKNLVDNPEHSYDNAVAALSCWVAASKWWLNTDRVTWAGF